METFLQWPKENGLTGLLEKWKEVFLTVPGIHSKPSYHLPDGESKDVAVTQKGIGKELAKASFGQYRVEVLSRWSTSSGTVNGKFVFKVSRSGGNFTIRDWLVLLKAFKLYWLLNHDLTNGELLSLEFGDVTLRTSERFLRANKKNVEGSKKAPTIEDDFNAQLLAKTTHFFLGGKREQPEGKISLALSRLIYYRFTPRRKVLEQEAAELVFALDAIAAEIATGEIKTRNKKSKKEIKAGIERVLEKIEAIKSKLPEPVTDFYLKDPNDIYSNLVRASFRESIRVCFEKLGVDYETHAAVIDDMSEVRQQIVHSQGYDSDFLARILLTQGTINVANNPRGQTITWGQKTGRLDEFYDLLTIVSEKYFDQYEQFLPKAKRASKKQSA